MVLVVHLIRKLIHEGEKMPRSATFSITAAGSHSSAHNSREEKPKYLIDQLKIDDKPIGNFYDLRHSDSDFLKLASAKYKETIGQKMQQKQIDALIKETVLSLEPHHTEADVQKVFDKLAAKYGGHYITELSIHRDEGHFEDKNGITYYPTKDILKKGDEWFIIPLIESITHAPDYCPKAEEFSEKVNINDFKSIHNVHAHVKFSMFNPDIGKTGRMKHGQLNDRITTAAKVLELEYKPEKKSNKRTSVADKKNEWKAVRNEKVRNFLQYGQILKAKEEEIEELKAHIAKGIPKTIEGYDFREVQQFITSLSIDPADKKDIHGLNNALKRSIKAGGGSEELKTLSLRIERFKAQETANKQKLTDLAVKIKAIPALPPIPYSVEIITPVIERRFLAIEEELIHERKKYEEQIKGEIAEKEVFADMVAELHHAYEHEPEKIEPALIRQRDEMIKKPKPAYKTALQRRDQAYKERLGREPKKSYSGPKMRVTS